MIPLAALALILTMAALVGWVILLTTGDDAEIGRILPGRWRRP